MNMASFEDRKSSKHERRFEWREDALADWLNRRSLTLPVETAVRRGGF
jgi:hypothetical protein